MGVPNNIEMVSLFSMYNLFLLWFSNVLLDYDDDDVDDDEYDIYHLVRMILTHTPHIIVYTTYVTETVDMSSYGINAHKFFVPLVTL